MRETAEHPLVNVKFVIKPYNTTVVFDKVMSRIDLDTTNQKILEILGGEARSSGDIARVVGLSRQAVVGRLRNLRTLGLVSQVGEGPRTLYRYSKNIS